MAAIHPTMAGASVPAFTEATYRKVTWRLIPFLFTCYILAYLDRVNVGFAKLQMLNELKFSEAIYGLGAGIFFLGYFLFEIPSNLMLSKVGARRWIARIMVSWGILSSCMMFVSTPTQFYVLRFFLGAAEAGFFPGIILYLTYWYPSERRARIAALFMTAIPVSGVIGGPLSGWILKSFSGTGGWSGWQWLFLLEGLPTVFIGLMVLFYLDDGIAKAQWLTAEEKALLSQAVDKENANKSHRSMGAVFSNPQVWLIASIYFCMVMGLYGIGFWLPTLIKSTGVTDALEIGLLSAIPNGVAALCMVWVSRSSDARNERRWHVAIPGVVGALGLVLSVAFAQDKALSLAALTIATAGIMSVLPAFWSIPTAFLGGTAAAAGIALINSIGNLSGFVSPYMVGWIKDMTQSTQWGLYLLAMSLVLGSLLVLRLPAHTPNR